MGLWTFPVALGSQPGVPVYLLIARGIRADIERGRLLPGASLPGSRTLAKTLGVHRNTVLAAFRELQAEGWITTAGNLTRVAAPLPGPRPGALAPKAGPPAGLGFDLEPSPEPALVTGPLPPGTLAFHTGLPDLRLVPATLLARAFGRALRTRALLGYGDPWGDPQLREALAGLLSGIRGLAAGAGRLMVTGGSQMGLDLVARTLLKPGDRVAVEDPGYPPAWVTLRAAGAVLLPLPVDAGGLRLEALEAELLRAPLRALYCTPQHQFPTTVTLEPGRRRRLLELAARHRFAVIEDDYDCEFPFDGSTVLPLASADPGGVVVHLGSLSKVLAPGLRIGFATGPAQVLEGLARRRCSADRQGNQVLERALAELLEDGELQRHVRKMFRVYRTRRAALAEALRSLLGGVVEFSLPTGGMGIWAAVDPAVDVAAWTARALARGVLPESGIQFDFHGRPRSNLRLGFSSLDEEELWEAVRRLRAAL
jgi:GntR family transcriptional regulator/MocR family aminotransferase